MINSQKKAFDLFIVLNDLTAEGCPILALNLIDESKRKKLKILLLTFKETNNELLNQFRKRDITIVSFKLARSGINRYIKLLIFTFILTKRFKPHSILCFPLGWHSFLAIGSKLAGVKIFCTHAGNLAPNFKNSNYRKFNFLVKLGNPFTNKIICCSKYIENSVIKNFGINQSKTTCIYNSYDEEKFKFIKNPKLKKKIENQKKINIGMVGRFEAHKDQKSLIMAIQKLKERDIKTKLFLIGDGSLKSTLIELTKNLDLCNEVQFLGARNDIEKILEKIDIFVFSTTEDEGFGIALVEAMGKGLPTIASDVGACREILQDGKFGSLVKPYCSISIADSIEKILNEINYFTKKRTFAHKYVLKNFTKTQMAVNYFKVLDL